MALGQARLLGSILAQLGIGDGTKFLVCALPLLRLDLLQQFAASANGAVAGARRLALLPVLPALPRLGSSFRNTQMS